VILLNEELRWSFSRAAALFRAPSNFPQWVSHFFGEFPYDVDDFGSERMLAVPAGVVSGHNFLSGVELMGMSWSESVC